MLKLLFFMMLPAMLGTITTRDFRHNFLTDAKRWVKVNFTDWVANASGSAGSSTYSRNKGGAYRKNKGIPIQPRTTKQMAIRSNLASLSASWRGLAPDVITAWNSAAKSVKIVNSIGRAFEPTGHQYYIALNQTLLLWNTSTITNPPPFFNSPEMNIDDIEITQNTAGLLTGLDLVFQSPSAPGDNVEIWGCPPLSNGISNPGSAYRFLGLFDIATGLEVDLFTAYEAVFGTAVADSKIFLRARPCNQATGQTGIFQSISKLAS